MVAVERYLIILLMLISGTFLINSLLTLPLYHRGVIGPGFFPVAISTVLFILLLLSLIESFRQSRDISKESKKSTAPNVSRTIMFKQLSFLLVLFVSFALINVVGMLVSLGLFIFIGLLLIEKIRWLKSLQFSLGMVLFIYLVFDKWLGLLLPKGFLL